MESGVAFGNTGGWDRWAFVNRAVTLQAGVNTLRLTATGSSGANFDYLRVTEIPSQPPIPRIDISNAQTAEGTGSFLVFDVQLSNASTEAITLDLAATGSTARGGLMAEFMVSQSSDPIDFANREFEVSADGGITWQAAIQGTQVTFAPEQTALKVRLAVNDDLAREGETPETMTLSVGRVLRGTVDSLLDTGTGTIFDNDSLAPFDVTFQAELATYAGPAFFTGRGAEGTGYLDYQNAQGDFIEWTVDVAAAGIYDLSWRYANGSTNRPLALRVNNTLLEAGIAFNPTGGWDRWSLVHHSAFLQAGSNTIRLTATGNSGANFDSLRVVGDPGTTPTSL